jgi:hypothetical protein
MSLGSNDLRVRVESLPRAMLGILGRKSQRDNFIIATLSRRNIV